MFFIAGISPKIRQLDNNPRRCPACGLSRAYLRRMDHYLSLFFIPVFRVKKGEPFIICDRCEQTASGFGGDYISSTDPSQIRCPTCGSGLQSNFKYCPYCGKSI
jgi:rubrerythrin